MEGRPSNGSLDSASIPVGLVVELQLLTLAEQYLYPRRNWLQRQLYKKLPVLNFSKFRVEERIKTIRYTIDYLERAMAQGMRNDIQKRRTEQYIKALPTEVCHLTEWLKARV